MNNLEFRRSSIASKRIIVVVSDGRADWSYFDNGRLIKRFTQQFTLTEGHLTLDGEYLTGSDGWDAGQENTFFDVIINSHLDDVDRVKVQKPELKRQSWLSSYRLLRHLRSEYPDSSVWKLPAQYYPEVASLLHSVLSPTIRAWVKYIQQEGVLISHVVTVPQLLIRSYHGECQPVLFNLALDGNKQRHILIDKGAPVYLRCINGAFEGAEKYLDETLAYLTEFTDVDKRAIRVIKRVDDPEGTLVCTQSVWLSSLLLRYSGNIDSHTKLSGLLPVENSEEGAVQNGICKVDKVSPGKSMAGVFFHNLFVSLIDRAKSTLTFFSSQSPSVNPFFILEYPIGKMSELQPSVEAQKRMRVSRYYRALHRMLVVLAIAALLLSLVSFAGFIRENNKIRSEQSQLSLRIKAVGDVVLGLHKMPDLALRSLQRRQWFSMNSQVTPESVMRHVANTIIEYPNVRLNTLLWIVEEDDQHSSEQVLSIQRSAVRVIDESIERFGQKVSINVKGEITLGDSSLRQAQTYFEKYVRHLNRDQQIANVIVSEAPVDGVRTKDERMPHQYAFEITMVLFYL